MFLLGHHPKGSIKSSDSKEIYSPHLTVREKEAGPGTEGEGSLWREQPHMVAGEVLSKSEKWLCSVPSAHFFYIL